MSRWLKSSTLTSSLLEGTPKNLHRTRDTQNLHRKEPAVSWDWQPLAHTSIIAMLYSKRPVYYTFCLPDDSMRLALSLPHSICRFGDWGTESEGLRHHATATQWWAQAWRVPVLKVLQSPASQGTGHTGVLGGDPIQVAIESKSSETFTEIWQRSVISVKIVRD